METIQIRLPQSYWEVIDAYGDWKTVCNSVIQYCIDNDNYVLKQEKNADVNQYAQTCRTLTIENAELTQLFYIYDKRTISVRRMLVYCIDGGIDEAFTYGLNQDSLQYLNDIHKGKVITQITRIHNEVDKLIKMINRSNLNDINAIHILHNILQPLEELSEYYEGTQHINEHKDNDNK